jgi:hypothetical protein
MEKLTLESLAEVDDGSVAIAVNQFITQCYHEGHNRPCQDNYRQVATS